MQGESTCDDTSDFAVDFNGSGTLIDFDPGTDAGIDAGTDTDTNSNTDEDVTKWGEDDGIMICGADEPADGAWFVFVRTPTCNDGYLNLDETDVDCGGSECLPCLSGLACIDESDCIVEECNDGICMTTPVLVYTDTLGSTCVWPNHTGIGFTPGLNQTDFSGRPSAIRIDITFSGTTANAEADPQIEIFNAISCTASSDVRLGTATIAMPASGAVGTVSAFVDDPSDLFGGRRVSLARLVCPPREIWHENRI
jgi:hypothetical protein